MDKRCENASERYDNNDSNDNLKIISLECGSKGLGIRLSKSSWDPYPFVSHVDEESTAQKRGLQIGDCLLKVNGQDCLGRQIQDVAKQIHSQTDDVNNNEVNLLLWRSRNLQQGYQPQLLHHLVSDLINVFQLMECPVCMETPTTPTHTFQCVNGHIVCEKCRPKTLRCPMCRVQMGRGRCLVADKILGYLQNNSTIKIGLICDSEKMSLDIDEKKGQRTTDSISSDDRKSSEHLHEKRSTFLPFKLKLKTITFWKDS